MDKLSKVRADIERLIEQTKPYLGACAGQVVAEANSKIAAYNDVLCILDSMKKETVSEDLYTVAKEYANNITDKIGYRLQLRRAVCFGANWKEQQLMEKAVDAVVKVDAGGYPYIDRTIELYDYDKDIPLAKRGDKYKVILIKEG